MVSFSLLQLIELGSLPGLMSISTWITRPLASCVTMTFGSDGVGPGSLGLS